MFVRVVETGNVSAAARSLYIAQSAVSAQLTALSRNAGVPLLERTSGRWEATAQGVLFYHAAHSILARLDQLERDLIQSSLPYSGRFKMASTRTVSDTVLASILDGFARAYPDIHVEVLSGDKHDAEIRLASDDVDLALVALPLALRGIDVHPFDEDELIAVLQPNHPLAKRKAVRFEEIESEPFVVFAQGSGVRSLLEERLGTRFSALEIKLELTSNDAIVAAVESGLGVALLPRRTAERWQRCGAVAAARITNVDFRRPLALVLRSNRTHSATCLKFVEWLLAQSDGSHHYSI